MSDDDLIADLLPEWASFRDAVASRDPAHGTACAAWSTRDVIAHQAGNAVELARVLTAHLDRLPVPATRSFEEREAPFLRLGDDDRLATLEEVVGDLAHVLERGCDEPDEWVPWTRRRMKVAWFSEHMRSELILHRWDLVGDDAEAGVQLAQPWMTTHSVEAVGAPLLSRGAGASTSAEFTGRLRTPEQPDVVITGGVQPGLALRPADPAIDPELVCDAAARVLLLWGRTPGDSTRLRSEVGASRLGTVRTLLSGY